MKSRLIREDPDEKKKKKKTLMLGKIQARRRRGRQRMRWLDGITVSMDMSLRKFLGDSEGEGSLVCCSPWDRKELDTM